jgi:hypothetical protein
MLAALAKLSRKNEREVLIFWACLFSLLWRSVDRTFAEGD